MRGILFYMAALALGTALGAASFLGVYLWQDARYLRSAEEFVEGLVVPAMREWRPAWFEEHASAELRRALPGESLGLYVDTLSEVGTLQQVHAMEGSLAGRPLFDFSPPQGALFMLDAQYGNDRARTEVALVLADGTWKLDSIYIDSPVLKE